MDTWGGSWKYQYCVRQLWRGLECVGEIPEEQFIDPVDRILGDAGQDHAQIEIWIKATELGRSNQRLNGGGSLAL
jgi:hypothetical protein